MTTTVPEAPLPVSIAVDVFPVLVNPVFVDPVLMIPELVVPVLVFPDETTPVFIDPVTNIFESDTDVKIAWELATSSEANEVGTSHNTMTTRSPVLIAFLENRENIETRG